jgi:rubrerythrin
MNAIEIAIKMEKDAIKFYSEAAEKTSHLVGKKMFLSITEDEKRHLEMLSQIFKEMKVTIKDVNPMKNIRTVFETLKDKMQEKIKATSDELDAFKIAMQIEQEGIEFYKKAGSEAKSEKEKALFERLAKEEQQHYDIFSNTYSFLTDTGNWFMWEEHTIVEG